VWRPATRLKNAKVLIVDEIFSAHPIIFMILVAICQGIRENFEHPFGGLGVLLAGDPLQGMAVNNEDTCLDRKF